MIEKLRQKILGFINAPKDVPLLAGFSVGVYMALFYYAQNYSLANSWQQLLYLVGYYAVLPAVVLFAAYKIVGFTPFKAYQKNILFVGMIAFLSYYIIEIVHVPLSKKVALAGVIGLSAIVSFWFKQYYKLFVILLLFLSLFNLYTVTGIIVSTQTASAEWQKLPDTIDKAVFKQKPNIYYIQPDGYTNAENLKGDNYKFDNTDFDGYLKQSGFKVYDGFRSNYHTTLLSNSSMFAMQHHYAQEDMDPYNARNVIIGNNPVLRALKGNGYRTSFITERPYLIINRPKMGYDFCNFDYNELPYFQDGWSSQRDVTADLRLQINKNKKTGNFYFIEKMTPGHINNNAPSLGIDGERAAYLERIKEANIWLKEILSLITKADPNAIIIIGADHGGFAGFEYMGKTENLITDTKLNKSMYGALLAIKWNNPAYNDYDADLKTSVNLFRTVFAFLSEDKDYLKDYQQNNSYMRTLRPSGVYKYINDAGLPVIEPVQSK